MPLVAGLEDSPDTPTAPVVPHFEITPPTPLAAETPATPTTPSSASSASTDSTPASPTSPTTTAATAIDRQSLHTAFSETHGEPSSESQHGEPEPVVEAPGAVVPLLPWVPVTIRWFGNVKMISALAREYLKTLTFKVCTSA